MSRVTEFAARDPGPAARLSGFMSHLRSNGLRLGVAVLQLHPMEVMEKRKVTARAN